MIINDDNGTINVVGDTPWKHSEEPELMVEGKGFRLLEVNYVAEEYECLPGRLARVRAKDVVFTSAFARLFYGFSDFLTMMIEEQIFESAEDIIEEYMDAAEMIMGSIEPVKGCTFRVTYWLESNESVRMEFNGAEVREYLKMSDPEKIKKLEFCEELIRFRSRSGCEMLIDQMHNALDAEADE